MPLLGDGTIATGERDIDDEQAGVIGRIFTQYVSGLSPRTIARALNTENVRGPRGVRWTASLILGNAVRETSILRYRLYAGELAWNRQKFMKDPGTGKRVARPRPRAEWIIQLMPPLRIVDNFLWAAAQERLVAMRQLVTDDPADEGSEETGFNRGYYLGKTKRPVWLLAGLVRCGLCNGPLSVVATDGRLGCSNHRERDTCTNKRTLLRGKLEARAMAGLKLRLLAPELIEAFVSDYVAEVTAAIGDRGKRRSSLEVERSEITRQIHNTVEIIKDGGRTRSTIAALKQLESRQDELAAEITAAGAEEPVPFPSLHPNLAEIYSAQIEDLETALTDPATAEAASAAIRSPIDAIVMFPGERRGELRLELRGDLAAFLHLGDAETPAPSANLRGGSGRLGEVLGSVIAGIRNHLDLLLTG